MIQPAISPDGQRVRINKSELVARLLKFLPEDGTKEFFPGFSLARLSAPKETRSVLKPAFCFVIQGRKRVLLGDDVFWYDPGNYLIFTVDLPVIFQVVEASPETPYLGFRFDLDPALVASVLVDSGIEPGKGAASVKAMDVSAMDADLLDAVVRLIRLLDTPEHREILAPLIAREIIFRLLMGGQGARLSHLVASGGDTSRISRAIGHIRDHFDKPLQIEKIAREVGMSVSGFHHRFKIVTAMSPLQFQKQIRLQEARRLMLDEAMDAASAGFRVGYEDPAYFSREYKKVFGDSPRRDIARLRG